MALLFDLPEDEAGPLLPTDKVVAIREGRTLFADAPIIPDADEADQPKASLRYVRVWRPWGFGLRAFNAGFTIDDLHPNDAGHTALTAPFAEFLKRLI